MPHMAQSGREVVSALGPLSSVKRKSDFEAVRSANDPHATLAVTQRTRF
jgi:hypothetical protein